MEILVISFSAPYDGVGQAGEKTHNYYLKSFQQEDDMQVRLISFCSENAQKKLDLEYYGIINCIMVEREDKISVIKRKLARTASLINNPNDKYANFVSKARRSFVTTTLNEWKKSGYKPNCIILEWTHMILLAANIKNMFPGVPIIASSHDVNYIGSKRRYDFETNSLIKFFRNRQYNNLKKREVESLAICDLIVPHNKNDVNILRNNPELENKEFFKIVPYYDSYRHIKRNTEDNLIIFFGAMGRPENYLSIRWFVEEVFSKLDNKYQLAIIGGNPPEFVQAYASDYITVTGFLPQSEVESFFERCTCMVVPLKLGSGIKVKVLEAFSASIPVLTNTIGNEGIFAEENKEYIKCETSDEYIQALSRILDNQEKVQKIGVNARKYLDKEFDLEKSKENYISKIRNIVEGC